MGKFPFDEAIDIITPPAWIQVLARQHPHSLRTHLWWDNIPQPEDPPDETTSHSWGSVSTRHIPQWGLFLPCWDLLRPVSWVSYVEVEPPGTSHAEKTSNQPGSTLTKNIPKPGDPHRWGNILQWGQALPWRNLHRLPWSQPCRVGASWGPSCRENIMMLFKIQPINLIVNRQLNHLISDIN
jgi:hypothetical protein